MSEHIRRAQLAALLARYEAQELPPVSDTGPARARCLRARRAQAWRPALFGLGLGCGAVVCALQVPGSSDVVGWLLLTGTFTLCALMFGTVALGINSVAPR